MLLDKTAIPSWLNPNAVRADQEPYITYSGMAFPINIQPESATVTAITEGEYFATFHFFTTYSGLRPGWRLTISGSNPLDVYTVKGVQRYTFGVGQHFEGTLIKENQ